MPPKKFRRRSSNGRHRLVATREGSKWLLAEPRSAESEEAWNTLVAKFPPEDHVTGSVAAAAAVPASATDVEDGNAFPWRRDDEYASEVLFDIISSGHALLGLGTDGQRFAHLQSCLLYTSDAADE